MMNSIKECELKIKFKYKKVKKNKVFINYISIVWRMIFYLNFYFNYNVIKELVFEFFVYNFKLRSGIDIDMFFVNIEINID